MGADFSQPNLTSLYSTMLNDLKDRNVDAIKMLDNTASINVPSGAKRWNSTNNYFEKFDGSAWTTLTTKYMINVNSIDGCIINNNGSTVTDIWTADKINTQLGYKLNISSYTASDILTKLKTVDGSGSGLDADLLDGMNASSSNSISSIVMRDSSGNFSAGTITATLNGAATSAISSNTANTLIGDQTSWASYRANAVSNMLGWKNFGNGHVIFDASNSTSPAGTSINNSNSQIAWTPSYPILMGWNGTTTYGVRVDSARTSDIATNANNALNADKLINKNWYWSGQEGQPAWLWGGTDGSNMYVYNPSNFSVNYATTAGNGGVTSVNGLTGDVLIGSIGIGQTWQNMTSLRANGVSYINNTGKPIQVSIWVNQTTGCTPYIVCDGITVAWANFQNYGSGAQAGCFVTAIIPNNSTYKLYNFSYVLELR